MLTRPEASELAHCRYLGEGYAVPTQCNQRTFIDDRGLVRAPSVGAGRHS